jgi:membrane protein required for colicin V production
LNLLDIIIIAIVIIGFILGYKDGFVRKIIGLIGLALAIYLAVKYSAVFGNMIVTWFGIEFYLSQIIAGVLIFFAVIAIFSIIKRIVHPFDKVNNFINQIVGGFVGAIQILFFLSAVFFLLNIFNAPSKKAKDGSLLYKDVYNIIPVTVDYLNSFTPKTKEFIKDYINDKDSVK